MKNTQVISAQDKVEKISKIVLWGLIGLSIVVTALYLLVGYDTPYEENPTFNAPQMLDLLLCWTYFLIIATAVIATAAVIYSFVNGSNKSKHEEKGLLGKTNWLAWGPCLLSLIIGAAVGIANKDESLLINGKDWNEPTKIIMTDTSMISILILTIITIIVTVFSMATNKK